MSVAIRLSRGGAKKRPYYKIVVIDSRTARDGKFIERIGSYNPMLPKDSEERVKIDADRARHWLSVGAQPSDRVARFLDAAGVKERTAKVNVKKGEPGEKAKERATERAERDEAAAAAAAEAAAAPAPEPEVEEAPAEAPAAEAEVAPVADEAPAAAEPEPAPAPAAEEAPAATENATNEGQSTSEPAEGGEGEPTNEGQSTAEPAEGGDDQTPTEGAEKAE